MTHQTQTLPDQEERNPQADKAPWILPVTGMSCVSCSGKVEKALTMLPGVEQATVDLTGGTVSVIGEAELGELMAAIKGAGYDVPAVSETFTIQGLSCASCVAKAEKALAAVPGVQQVEVNLAVGRVSITHLRETVSFRQLQNSVREIGYDLDRIDASDFAESASQTGGGLSPWLAGSGGASALFLFFIGFITVTDNLAHAWEQFLRMWPAVTLLALGFGTQVGLYVYLRNALHEKRTTGATAGVAASGGVSTVSMLACCAHLLPSVLPILGLSAASIFLAQYQVPLILLGLFSNLVGITIMLSLIQSHGLAPESGWARSVFRLNFVRVRNATAAVAVAAVGIAFLNVGETDAQVGMIAPAESQDIQSVQAKSEWSNLPSRTNRAGAVEVTVTPEAVRYGEPLAFSIALNTHSGSLDVDLTRSALLGDDQGNAYLPTAWEGDPPGGHHRSGLLRFSPLKPGAGLLKLTIKDVNRVPERVFRWTLSQPG